LVVVVIVDEELWCCQKDVTIGTVVTRGDDGVESAHRGIRIDSFKVFEFATRLSTA
jgi:hypothetical protein